MRRFLIDTDTASDDAVALIMALRAPDVRVEAITVVSGNVPLKQATENALYTVELCGADVPVFMGEERPLRREPSHADWFHGADGFGNSNFPPAKMRPQKEHAVDAIIRGLHTKLAHFAIDINRTAMEANRNQSGEIGIALPDPVAMAVAIDPTIAIRSSEHQVEIECESELTRGMTVVDRLNVSRDPRNRGVWSSVAPVPIDVVWEIDIPRWKKLLYRSLS